MGVRMGQMEKQADNIGTDWERMKKNHKNQV